MTKPERKRTTATEPSTRIYALLAGHANIGVVLRRGPSKYVQMLLWHTRTDEFEEGQWLKGRVYERRCDLSPTGRYFAYFAASYKPPLYSWTAVSKPPYFTALGLWPVGTGWGGGALFENDNSLLLNHLTLNMTAHAEYAIPKRFRVGRLHEHAGGGEDFPIWEARLQREGWCCTHEGVRVESRPGISWSFDPPISYSKPFSYNSRCAFVLNMMIKGLHQSDGPWYVIDYSVTGPNQELYFSLPETDWADWDSNGDLLFARQGKIFRLRASTRSPFLPLVDEACELIDLTENRFTNMAPPANALKW